MSNIEIKNICHKYQDINGEISAIDNISFTANDGEYISIVGPSGCGKSTILSIICGLITPTSGSVLIDGEKISGISNKIGYMLQKDNLLDWRTIYKNVILSLELQNQLTDENKQYAIDLLKKYGLYEFKDKYPSQLSGGMRQRAALIRTLASKPEILLLDEAFSALDYQTRLLVREDVYAIIKNEKKTTIMVTHDIDESISMSDRVIVLTKRPAKINDILTVDFGKDRSPMKVRNDEKFKEYFNKVWKELDIHV
ncbi:MAG: ABC transporter ATP-binding protein [Ruminococcaceae bacterium]|nr:ABC transporter ATP-binding protein [Oscillospiraceae bacterium]